MSKEGRVVQSEIRKITRNGVTETIKTEVIETYSSNGTPCRTSRTTTTTSGQKIVGGRSSSSSSKDSSPEMHKRRGVSDIMAKLSIKSDKKDKREQKHPVPQTNGHSKGGRTHHSSSSDSDSDSDGEDFAKMCLKQHNHYRSKHGVASLKLSKPMCKYAQEWAEKCASSDSMRHRDSHKYGENIFMEWSSNPKFKVDAKKPVDDWYNEIRNHKFGCEPKSMGTGHFTQVVWKGSKELGVGISKSRSGKVYVVANYDPPAPAHRRPPSAELQDAMESLESKLKRMRDAMGRFSLNGNHMRSRPCVTWADDELTNNTPSSPNLLQRIQSMSGYRQSPTTRRRPQQLDNRPSPARGRRLFYANSMPAPGTSAQHSPTSAQQPTLHVVSSSPCLRRMTHAMTSHNSFTLPVKGTLDNRPQGSPSSEVPSPGSGKNTPMAVSPNLAAKVLFSRPLSVNHRHDDMETFYEESDFVTDCVHWHNILRQKHQAPPILLSSELCQSAQEWANHMAHNETFYHRNPRNVGENLFTRFSCAPEFDVNGREAVVCWYSGIKQYNFNAEPDLQHCNAGQFTQLVWKNTTEIGVGKARTRGGKIFVVAHYRPQGNIIGQFHDNVLPPVQLDASPNDTSGQELSSPEATSSTTS